MAVNHLTPQQARAYRVYLTFNAASSLAYSMVFTLFNIYMVSTAQLDPLQLVLLGTGLELSVFIFEVPTGVVADVFSRRLSVLIGIFIIGAGFILTGAWPSFWPILVGQVLWGLGYTFTSGAQQAWISDEIGEQRATAAFLRAAQLENAGALLGVILGTGLGILGYHIPIIVGGVLFILLGGWMIWQMPEEGFTPTPAGERTTWQRMAQTFRDGLRMVRLRPALIGILLIGLVYGLYSEGFDRLWTAHMLERFAIEGRNGLSTVTWFGLIRFVQIGLGIIALEGVNRRVDLAKPRNLAWVLEIASAGLVVGLAGFALTGDFALAIGLVWIISVLRQVIGPLYTGWVNHRLDPQVRATVISMSSQTDALGQIGGGPLVGLIAQRITLQAGLLASTAMLTPVLALLGWQIKNKEA